MDERDSVVNLPSSTKGVLRPDEIADVAGLVRDHEVSPALIPFVECYWSVRWQLPSGHAHRAEVLSHPSVNVSVESGDGPRFGHELPAVLLHGVVTRRFSVDLVGSGRVTAVKFRPGGFTALTGHPPLVDAVHRLSELTGIDMAGIAPDVLREDSDGERAAALDQALLPLARDPDERYLELLAIVDEMQTDRTLLRVAAVAARSGRTVRSLQRLFDAFVGVGPKWVLARYRLHEAVAAIDAGEVTDLAALAASLGWFDQAHFNRDFRNVAGLTPGAYLRRAKTEATADRRPAAVR